MNTFRSSDPFKQFARTPFDLWIERYIDRYDRERLLIPEIGAETAGEEFTDALQSLDWIPEIAESKRQAGDGRKGTVGETAPSLMLRWEIRTGQIKRYKRAADCCRHTTEDQTHETSTFRYQA